MVHYQTIRRGVKYGAMLKVDQHLLLVRLGTLLNYNFEINPITILFRKVCIHGKNTPRRNGPS